MKQQVIMKAISVLAVVPLTACGGSFDIYSPSQIHRTVQLTKQGVYIVDYRWREVAEQFGKDRATAVPKYLEAKGLTPPECVHGVTVIRGGEVESGGGWAEFRCK